MKRTYNQINSEKPSTMPQQSPQPILIENLLVVRHLGNGGFGRVDLVRDSVTGTYAAIKTINKKNLNEAMLLNLKSEILINLTLKPHINIVRCYHRIEIQDYVRLYLEYADRGDLLNQIESSVGLNPPVVQNYFRQLIVGLQYLHDNGIAHRDIKLKNIVTTTSSVLKICDFGVATKYRNNGLECLMNSRCGTLSYRAPEMLADKFYRGESVDVWSAGIVFVSMLTGVRPWEEATVKSEKFNNYVKMNFMKTRPWNRLSLMEISLIKIMLCVNSCKRASLERIRKHPWMYLDLSNHSVHRTIPIAPEPLDPSESLHDTVVVDPMTNYLVLPPSDYFSLKYQLSLSY